MESSFTDEDIHEHIASWQHLDKTCLRYQALDTVDTSDDIWYGVRAVALVCACCFGKFCEFSFAKAVNLIFLLTTPSCNVVWRQLGIDLLVVSLIPFHSHSSNKRWATYTTTVVPFKSSTSLPDPIPNVLEESSHNDTILCIVMYSYTTVYVYLRDIIVSSLYPWRTHWQLIWVFHPRDDPSSKRKPPARHYKRTFLADHSRSRSSVSRQEFGVRMR